jgi:histidinol-phosphate aminotransferase
MGVDAERSVIRAAAGLEGLSAYVAPPKDAGVDLWLDLNEGPGVSDRAMTALKSVSPEAVRRYAGAAALEARIAERWGIDAGRIVVTAGADAAIDAVCRVTLGPGRELLWHTPGFEMIERYARITGAGVRSVSWVEGAFPVAAYLDAVGDATGLMAVITPNNPTGGEVGLEDLLALADRAEEAGCVLMVDLAYGEFADADPTLALVERPNVVVLRTFSKALGLAALRVGYAIASEPVVGWLRTVVSPFPAATVAMAAAGAVLDDAEATALAVERVRRERGALAKLLAGLGAEPWWGDGGGANFVLARFGSAERAAAVRGGLRERGIAVRAFGQKPGLEDAIRITCPGEQAAFERLSGALREVMGGER